MAQGDKAIAFLAKNDEERMLLSHTEDLLMRAETGAVVRSAFLNLGEQYLIRAFLVQCGKREWTDFCFFGGYPHAERCKLFLFPDYLAETILYQCAEDPTAVPADVCFQHVEGEGSVSALSVTGSGYKVLSHRDYLGSLLALGIERSVIGDIAVLDDANAVIFADDTMTAYLHTALERIGHDKVRCRILSHEDARNIPDSRRYETFSDTVASLRLDGILAAACNLSRDKAKTLVSSGMVTVDFRPTESPDLEIAPGAILSVRGFGRYIFDACDGTSKKGRLRIRLKKLI